ncbi:ligand-binding sensor domain-containing diguanylate cyclase [Arenimonas fontis]|uniref:ligand-binding sensor domain-containing diguanylate cyclase n=1 Tax=Arenimonas fontis TaxID=2608255 RepID=UPI001661F66D|nr:ligand-binding sensor domain-containing diguanylate cyclase [Arenimonas fontis]
MAALRTVLTSVLTLALLAAAGPAPALDPDKAFHHYVRNRWSIEEGLPQISALTIAQDRLGYLWVGTQAGLARFDGVRFLTYNPENTPGLAGIWIHALHVDADNRVWIATYRGLSVYEDGRFETVAVEGRDGTPMDTRALAVLADGRLAVAGQEGVYVVEGDAGKRRLRLLHPLPRPAYSLLQRGDGLWVGSLGQAYRIEGQWVGVLPLPENAGDAVVTQLAEAQGRVWAGTSAGLFHREGNAWKRHESGEPLARAPIEDIFEDGDGNLWVAMTSGLARLQAGRLRELVGDQDPAASAVRAIFEDREGNLWLGGQWEGITRLWNGWTRRYSTRDGLQHPMLWSVARGPDGRLWVGTNDGLAVMEGGRFREVVAGEDLPHPNAYTLLIEDEVVWIGTRRGAVRLRGDRLERTPELAPLGGLQVNGIVRDRLNRLWFMTSGGLFQWSADGMRHYDSRHGLRSPFVRLMHETRSGRLLLGTQTGLYEMNEGQLLPLGEDKGLQANLDITAIHELPDGRLVVGTLSEELYLFDGARWHRFGKDSGLPVNSPFFISHSPDGWLWVAGIRGIYRVPLDDLTDMAAGRREQVRGQMLLNERGDRRGGQQGFCCNGAGNAKGLHLGDELWLPTRDGLVAMSTRDIHTNAVPPRTVVERVRVGDRWRLADPREDWQLPLGQRDLAFEFTVLSLQEPRSVEMRYRLVGYDEDWRELEDPTRRQAGYTNLPPGAYVFEVIGANNAGVWADSPAQIGFVIPPYFHETGLFRLLLAALLASLVYAGYRRQREALEKLVRQRTDALQAANLRLEEASQTDPLTGLRNRRYLTNQIPADIAFYEREVLRREPDEVMLFALVDIDHFKAVNDTHGHHAGDRVLQQFAQVLSSLVRSGDYIARWGGEEFLVVFRPMPGRHLPVLGERIRTAIANHRFEIGLPEPLRLTCSIGLVECPLFRESRGSLGWEQMVELADRALYYVKTHGRNGWAAYRPLPGSSPEVLMQALRGDHERLLESGRMRLLSSGAPGERAEA